MKSSFLLSALLVLLLSSFHATAEPFVCFQGNLNSAATALDAKVWLAGDMDELAWAPTCKSLDNLSFGIKATSITLTVGAFYAACTGAGAPAAVVLEGGALGLQVVDLIVGQLPCEDPTNDEQVQQMANEAVCRALEQNGITCELK